MRHRKALVDIISMVKHAAHEESPLLNSAERVAVAFERVTRGQTFTPEQQAWLDRIRTVMQANLSIDREDFDYQDALVRHGGWGAARRAFGPERLGAQHRLDPEHRVERFARALARRGHLEARDLLAREVVLLGRQDARYAAPVEDRLSPGNCSSPPARQEGIGVGGGLGDGGEEGDLGPAQVLDRLVEVDAGGVGDPVRPVAVRDDAQVLGEDTGRSTSMPPSSATPITR